MDNLKIAHFWTNNRYISFLEYKSLYSFWLQHRDWTRLTDQKYYKDYFLGIWEAK